MILALTARRYRVQLVPGQHIEPQPYITLRPKPGIRERIAAR
jgi:hypothetical protein